MNTPASPAAFWRRWLIYFAERFPPLKHGLLIGAFCFGLQGYASRAGGLSMPLPVFGLAFVSVFLMLLQLRLLDEFKDYDDDCRWRPYRPVPRGLITLAQLRRLWLLAAAIQITVALWLDARLLAGLVLIWLYSALMGVEFFVRDWLKAHPLVYMLSHIVIVPMMALYVLACQRWPPLAAGLGSLLAASYFAFCVIEVGRKIRAPDEEEAGVETYSALWGRPGALAAWLSFMVLGSLCGIGAAAQIGLGWHQAGLLGLVLLLAARLGVRFLSRPLDGERFNRLSGGWTLALFLGLGLLALFAKGGA